MMASLGSHDGRYISSPVTDIHRFILPLSVVLRLEIAANDDTLSPLP